MKRTPSRLFTAGLIVLLYGASSASAQTAPPLGLVQQFSVLGNSAVTGSTGTGTAVTGDVGSSPTATISNFPPSTVVGGFTLHSTNDATTVTARANANSAYGSLAAQGPGTVRAAQLDGAVLTSGIYSFTGGAADIAAGGTLTLNGPGIFVFQVDSALTANTGSSIAGSADPCNVYWRIGTSATLNGTSFRGQVFAEASITVGSGSVSGRTIAGSIAGGTGAVTMTGSGGNTIGGCASAPVVPVCPTITLSPATLSNGTVAIAMSQTITGSGGTSPYSFSLFSGSLPAGLTLTAAGVLAGTPTTAGTFTFTIRGTDANGCTGDRAYTITIAAAAVPPVCPTITLSPSSLPNGMVLVSYNQTMSGSGGTSPYSFGVTSGTLPTGLTLASNGPLFGTPTIAGTSNFTIRGTDANGCFAATAYTIVVAAALIPPAVCPTITLSPTTLLDGAAGIFSSQTITTSGGTAPLNFGVASGALPSGMSLNSAGVYFGIPTLASTFTFTARATDSVGCFGQRSYTVTMANAVPTMPETLLILLALILGAIGYKRVRRLPRVE